jgi:DNA-binding winged helix-turn-helix (wHTH) protein
MSISIWPNIGSGRHAVLVESSENSNFKDPVRLVFGECELDSGQRLLRRHGSIRPLTPKAFQLLEFLLDRRPEAISKREIFDHLWPETFVSDASLHNLVADIRAALGDDPRATRYIRTVPQYGYAFHGEARPADDVSQAARAGPRLVSRRREWLLSAGSNVVGRDQECAVRIDSAAVSRRHARIVVTNCEATLEDFGSKNGTYVNGQRIKQPAVLKDNDELRVGPVTMRFRVMEALPSTLTERRS